MLALAFGPSYSYVLLRMVYGQRWSNTEAPAALSYYCGYITLLALNGCTEAYVNATADSRWHLALLEHLGSAMHETHLDADMGAVNSMMGCSVYQLQLSISSCNCRLKAGQDAVAGRGDGARVSVQVIAESRCCYMPRIASIHCLRLWAA